MKDKRTYTNAKEHGEDMSHENEVKIEPGNLPYLIEMHKKEIWEWKQRESEHIKTITKRCICMTSDDICMTRAQSGLGHGPGWGPYGPDFA